MAVVLTGVWALRGHAIASPVAVGLATLALGCHVLELASPEVAPPWCTEALYGLFYAFATVMVVHEVGCASREEAPCEPECAAYEICDDGACFPKPCDSALDPAESCGPDLLCVEGGCRPGRVFDCQVDEDCADGRCVDGACFANECADGEPRACESVCGAGFERCLQGAWRGCDARQPAPAERCGDEVDDDCDGTADEGCVGCEDDMSRLCETACGGGQEQCVDGAWGPCDAPAPVDALRGASFLTAVAGGDGLITVYAQGEDIQLTPVSVEGEAGATRALTDLPGRSWMPSVVRRGGELLVAWADNVETPDDPFSNVVFVARLDLAGLPLGVPVRVGSGSEPQLVAAGAGYGLAWTARREGMPDSVLFTLLDANGAAVGEAIEVSGSPANARDAAVAFDGAEFLVVWTDYRDSPGRPLYGARLSGEGALLESAFRISPADRTAAMPRVVYDGARFGVAWYEGSGELNDRDTDVRFAVGTFQCP